MIYDPKSQRSNIRQIEKIKLAKPYKAKPETSPSARRGQIKTYKLGWRDSEKITAKI